MQNEKTYIFHEGALGNEAVTPQPYGAQRSVARSISECPPAALLVERAVNVSACDFETFCLIISLLSCYRSANSKQVLPLPSLNRNFSLSLVCVEKLISCEALFCARGKLIFSRQNCYEIAEVEWSKGNIYASLCEGSSGNAQTNINLTHQYNYNVRSWLTGIDNVHTSEYIAYNHKIDGICSGSSITYGDFIPCWNGNIAATTYLSSNGNITGFNYTYDGLNRLTSAEDTKNPPLGSLRNVKNYSSTYSYDLNGNITALTRNDGMVANDYTYGYTGNQLSTTTVNNSQQEAEEEVEYIFDGGRINSDNLQNLSGSMHQIVFSGKAKPTISTMFAYDLNGNFKSDNTKGTEYSYNVFNMPLQISVSNSEVIGTIKYKYDAQGNKLRADYSWLNVTSIDKIKDDVGKVTKPKNSTQYIEYAGNKRYKGKVLDMIHIDGGYIKGGEYYFYEKDHLGNNIAVIDTNGNLIQQTFYHPYGKPIDDLSFDLDVNNSQPYKYGGKEEETMLGLAMFDFHARQYYGNSDNRPPVFGQIDPLAGDYTNVSPYMYCLGNPIRWVDRDGRAPGDPFSSVGAAAKDWGNYYNGASIIRGKEFGSTIYSTNVNGKTVYKYSTANEGRSKSVQISNSPNGEKREATIHSHGEYDKNYNDNQFSKADKNNSDKRGVDSYVATPDGSLKKYDPNTKQTSTVSTDLPSDPKDPERKNNNDPTDVPAEKRTQTTAEQDKKPELKMPEQESNKFKWTF
jgi:RHS repeat-associated protein